jgi:hypothetical protein
MFLDMRNFLDLNLGCFEGWPWPVKKPVKTSNIRQFREDLERKIHKGKKGALIQS